MPAQSIPALTPQSSETAQLIQLIAGILDAPADAVLWRDVFCHECDAIECVEGSAQELADKIKSLGWIIADYPHTNLNCASCAEYEPAVSPFWAEAEHRYEEWKGARFDG